MTDKEIIKTLKTCILGDCEVCDCRCGSVGDCRDTLNKYSLDLIIRQQAEIEKLTINMNAFGLGMKREKERADQIKAEAIKEFWNELKKRSTLDWRMVSTITGDNLVKEMVGEGK